MTFLGQIATDTGVHSCVIPVFLGKVATSEIPCPEYDEAIASVVYLTQQQVEEGLMRGFLEVSIHGKEKHIPLRDAFLTFALLQAKMRQLL